MVGAVWMTPDSKHNAPLDTESLKAAARGASGNCVMRRLGDEEIRNLESGLHHRSLAQVSNSKSDGGGPYPSHFVNGFSSRSGSTSPTTQPRTDAAVTRGLGEGVVEGSIDCGDFGDDANRTQGGHA